MTMGSLLEYGIMTIGHYVLEYGVTGLLFDRVQYYDHGVTIRVRYDRGVNI